jgi:tubulin-specific chaperone A
LYKKEIDQGVLKRDKFVADGAEEWDIKNAVRTFEPTPTERSL